MSAGTAPARRSAHPVSGRRLPASRLAGRAGTWLQALGPGSAPDDGPKLGATPYTLMTTFRRDGRPVKTPVWAARDGDRLYVRSERRAGKVRRLRHDPRALVAPCTARGRPLAPEVEARGRVLAPDEEPAAERVLARRYGLGRAAFERGVDLLRVDMCYLELTLAEAGAKTGGTTWTAASSAA